MSGIDMNETDKKSTWWSKYNKEIFIVVFGLISMNLIFFAQAFRETDTINGTSAGQLGDFVGGYIGTLFVLGSIVLLYLNLKNQRNTTELLSFETKYFELIKMHRDNVAEMVLQKTSGRKIFVLLIREFRLILTIVKDVSAQCNLQLNRSQLIHVAYYCLYFGTGPNSSRMLINSLNEFDENFINTLEAELNNFYVKQKIKNERKLGYVPFEGHQSRLGHYYRHLFQAIHYVHKQELDINKYELIKTIRAQLTTHEQALLLLNSLTPIGENWWNKKLITKYKLVKNIPRDFFINESELDMSSLFEPNYFEWEEIIGTDLTPLTQHSVNQ